MPEVNHPLQVSPDALKRVIRLGLSGAPLNTFLALLAHLDQTGYARITQPELCKLLDSGPGRVWQNLQALVTSGVIEPPDVKPGAGRRAPYRVPKTVAVAPTVATPPRRRKRAPLTG